MRMCEPDLKYTGYKSSHAPTYSVFHSFKYPRTRCVGRCVSHDLHNQISAKLNPGSNVAGEAHINTTLFFFMPVLSSLVYCLLDQRNPERHLPVRHRMEPPDVPHSRPNMSLFKPSCTQAKPPQHRCTPLPQRGRGRSARRHRKAARPHRAAAGETPAPRHPARRRHAGRSAPGRPARRRRTHRAGEALP
jgi:hypothetical protein